MKAVITVIGKDQVGIIAAVSAKCAEYDVNILEITQSVLDRYFAMIMIADIDALKNDFSAFSDAFFAARAARRALYRPDANCHSS